MTKIYYILIFLHIALSVVYSIAYYLEFADKNTKLQELIFRFVITLTIPFFGFLFMWFSDIYEHKYDKIDQRDIEKLFSNDHELELLKPLNLDDEINKVPMVEALSLGDYTYRRKMVVDTLKEENTESYLGVLKEALLNEDSETSHYASAIIMDVQGKLTDLLFKKEIEFFEDSDNIEKAVNYENELYKVIKSGIYDKRNLHKFYVKYKIVSDKILETEKPNEVHIHNRIDIDFETEDTLHAKQMCEKYKELYPSSETMVVDNIKLCIKMQNRDALDQFFSELKDLPVLLTTEALSYIRFFERSNQ